MLTVKTKLKQSPISGIGLFADEPIKKGQPVWVFNPMIDILLTEDEMNQLSLPSKEQFLNYAYLDITIGKYLLCGDDARFFNHSDEPNCFDSNTNPDITVASKDIAIGEEITCNYKTFYGNMNEHPEIL